MSRAEALRNTSRNTAKMSAAVMAKLSASVGTRLAPTFAWSSDSPTTRIVAPPEGRTAAGRARPVGPAARLERPEVLLLRAAEHHRELRVRERARVDERAELGLGEQELLDVARQRARTPAGSGGSVSLARREVAAHPQERGRTDDGGHVRLAARSPRRSGRGRAAPPGR